MLTPGKASSRAMRSAVRAAVISAGGIRVAGSAVLGLPIDAQAMNRDYP